MDRSPPTPAPPRWWRAPEFIRSLPLFGLAGVFFVAGGVLRFAFPSYALYGPGVFTFWGLLIALGFICAIGGVVSWTLAGDAVPEGSTAPEAAPAPAYLPIDLPERTVPQAPVAVPVPRRARVDFGRPAPEVRATSAAGAWYEGPTDSERFVGPDFAPPIKVEPTGFPESTEDLARTEPVEQVLADLERIERDLAPRARTVEPTPA
jgi:hypothetical protein